MPNQNQAVIHDLKHPRAHVSDSRKHQLIERVRTDTDFESLLRRKAKPALRKKFWDALDSEDPFPQDVRDKIFTLVPDTRNMRAIIGILEILHQIRVREASEELVLSEKI